MARKQLRLHYGVVMIAPLFREKYLGAPAIRLDTDSNVSAVSYTHLDVYKRQRQYRTIPA